MKQPKKSCPALITPLPARTTPVPANLFPNKLASSVTNSIPRNLTPSFFCFILYCLNNGFFNRPESSRDLTISMSLISLFDIAIVVLDPKIFLGIPALAAEAAVILMVSAHFWPTESVHSLSMATRFSVLVQGV